MGKILKVRTILSNISLVTDRDTVKSISSTILSLIISFVNKRCHTWWPEWIHLGWCTLCRSYKCLFRFVSFLEFLISIFRMYLLKTEIFLNRLLESAIGAAKMNLFKCDLFYVQKKSQVIVSAEKYLWVYSFHIRTIKNDKIKFDNGHQFTVVFVKNGSKGINNNRPSKRWQ